MEYLSNENERLTSALISAREEIARLSSLVGGVAVTGGMVGGGVHAGHHGTTNGNANGSAQTNGSSSSTNGTGGGGGGGGAGSVVDGGKGGGPIGVNVNLPPAAKTAMAGGSSRGYGY